MLAVGVAHVGNAGEPTCERLPHVLRADKALAMCVGTAWRFEQRILGEVLHDPVKVVIVESPRDRANHVEPRGRVGHSFLLLGWAATMTAGCRIKCLVRVVTCS